MVKRGRETELNRPVVQHRPSVRPESLTLVDIEELARSKTEAALTVLAAIMYRESASPFARVAAAREILDRGWVKPVQPLATDKAPAQLLHRIERIIVHPDQSPIVDHRDDEIALSDFPIGAETWSKASR